MLLSGRVDGTLVVTLVPVLLVQPCQNDAATSVGGQYLPTRGHQEDKLSSNFEPEVSYLPWAKEQPCASKFSLMLLPFHLITFKMQ
eukprot:26062-Amphidinium_carterae.2